MDESLEKKIREAIADPKNMGELTDADRVGTVGNSDCGEMLRLWVKFKEDHGRKVIDQASFQSFGCETAIAVASMATELIRGKTADEALALRHDELTGDLGALPPMKIHCAQLVEGALKAALAADEATDKKTAPAETGAAENIPSLMDSLQAALADGSGDIAKLREGVELTARQLVSAFEKGKIVELNPVGEKFDPHRHQAISMVPAPQEPNTVVTVLQRGYTIADRVLRPALVTVSAPK